MAKTDWAAAFKPLLKKYKNKPHPLEYKNLYQLVVMVVLSAQDSDKNINVRTPEFFKTFPDMKTLAVAKEETIAPFLKSIRNGRNKGKWLLTMAQQIKTDKNIPLTMEALTALPGIGRKSANVIMRGAGVKAKGVIVDLHVVRVAPRLGVAIGADPKKIEQQIMDVVPQKDWGEIGMAISFLGRETCRPTNPHHAECVMNGVCEYYAAQKKTPAKKAVVVKPAKKAIAAKPAKKVAAAKPVKKNK